MGNRAALWLLRLAIANMLLGAVVVASAAANERERIAAEMVPADYGDVARLDGRVSKLEDFRLDAGPRLAVLESLAADVKETRRMSYGIGASLIINLLVSAAQLRRVISK